MSPVESIRGGLAVPKKQLMKLPAWVGAVLLVSGLCFIPSVFAERGYGPVKPRDVISRIARQNYKDSEFSRNQIMVAILRANPKAFYKGNINMLEVGVMLILPDDTQVATITETDARATLDQHKKHFRAGLKGTLNSKALAQVEPAKEANKETASPISDQKLVESDADKQIVSSTVTEEPGASEEKTDSEEKLLTPIPENLQPDIWEHNKGVINEQLDQQKNLTENQYDLVKRLEAVKDAKDKQLEELEDKIKELERLLENKKAQDEKKLSEEKARLASEEQAKRVEEERIKAEALLEQQRREAAEEQERLASEKAKAEIEEQERLAAEKAQQEEQAKAAAVEQERKAAEEAEQLRLKAEEQERLAAEKIKAQAEEQERLAAERAKQEEIAAAEQERKAAEKARQEEQTRLEAEEQARLAAEKAQAAEQELIAAEKRVAEEKRLADEKKTEGFPYPTWLKWIWVLLLLPLFLGIYLYRRHKKKEEKRLANQILSGYFNTDPTDVDIITENDLQSSSATSSAAYQECDIKLDMALAYIDLKQLSQAEDVLNEVMIEGNEQQQQEAENILAQYFNR